MSNYLSSLGFETIYAEDFDSFEEQIKYFDSVKILVSPTSAGLVNSLLMRKNQTVLEFEVPLITNQRQSLHSIYTGLCFLSGHLYISIPSMRNSKELINKINTNKKLLELISE
jgi:capsular polysaccharide biosynthesis protein